MPHDGPHETVAVSGGPWTSTDFPCSRSGGQVAFHIAAVQFARIHVARGVSPSCCHLSFLLSFRYQFN